MVFRDVTPRTSADRHQHFGKTCCIFFRYKLFLQTSSFTGTMTADKWNWVSWLDQCTIWAEPWLQAASYKNNITMFKSHIFSNKATKQRKIYIFNRKICKLILLLIQCNKAMPVAAFLLLDISYILSWQAFIHAIQNSREQTCKILILILWAVALLF